MSANAKHIGWMQTPGGGSQPANRSRRQLLGLTLGVGAVALVGTSCSTADQLSIIVPADAGGGWDQTGRRFEQVVSEQKLVGRSSVENIPGAGGTKGLAALKTEKNPNTLMVTGLVMVGAVESNKSNARIEDTTPIARVTEEPLAIVVPANSPYKTLKELVTAVVEKGKEVSINGGSAGGADHILAGLLLGAAGVSSADIGAKLNYIPNSGGGKAVSDLLSGSVNAGISGVGEFASYVKSGKFRGLAVSSDKPATLMPEVPTIKDSGYDVVLTNWRGLLAPGGIKPEARQKLIDLVTKVAQSDGWKKVLTDSGWTDAFLAGDQFDAFVKQNISEVTTTLAAVGLAQPKA